MTKVVMLNRHDYTYSYMLIDIMNVSEDWNPDKTEWQPNRTGIDTINTFGYMNSYDMQHGFPLLTTKKLFTKGIVHELLWFLKGTSDPKYLQKNGVSIWDEWIKENGDLGPVYGVQWRKWKNNVAHGIEGYAYIDQIANVINSLKNDPMSRRHIVSAWNVSELTEMALPPCHVIFQFNVRPISKNKQDKTDKKYYLDLMLTQRSADVFLGVPFNIASYSLLLHMVAQIVNMIPGRFIHAFGNLHLYKNHMEQANLQLKRAINGPFYKSPTLVLNPDIKNIDDFRYDDIKFEDYECHDAIKASVAV